MPIDRIYFVPSFKNYPEKYKGNGGKMGCSVGYHKPKTFTNGGSLSYGKGCLRHGIDNCENCTRPDCDWDYNVEWKLIKKLNNGGNK